MFSPLVIGGSATLIIVLVSLGVMLWRRNLLYTLLSLHLLLLGATYLLGIFNLPLYGVIVFTVGQLVLLLFTALMGRYYQHHQNLDVEAIEPPVKGQ